MKKNNRTMSGSDLDTKTDWFVGRCRAAGLKVTPQRVSIYRELISTNEHPSAEMLYKKLKGVFAGISLDTVNRTLLTLSEIGAASVVEGSGDAKRFEGGSGKHQHFRCVECKRIVDFHHKAFDDIKIPASIAKRFTVLKKTVYLEGICDLCKAARAGD